MIRQTRARILRGQASSDGKLLSIFEPNARIPRRGKLHKPTEFGALVKVQESEGGIVTGSGDRRHPPRFRAARTICRAPHRDLRCAADPGLHRSRLLLRNRCEEARGTWRASRRRAVSGETVAEATPLRETALVSARPSMARRRRGAHRSPQAPLRHGTQSLSRAERNLSHHLLGGHRKQPGRDRCCGVTNTLAIASTPAAAGHPRFGRGSAPQSSYGCTLSS